MPTPISVASSTKGPSRSGFTLLEVLMALLIIAVLAAVLSRILQSSLRSHLQIKQELTDAPIRQSHINRQFAGGLDDPVLELIPLKKESK